MVAQEDRPLAGLRDVRGLLEDLRDRVPVLLRDRHVHARHQREVVGHVALVAVAEVLADVLGPHVRLGQEQPVAVTLVQPAPELLDDLVGLAQVLVAGAVALDQVRDRVQTEPVDAHVEPEAQDLQHLCAHGGVVEVQVRLVAEEPVPVVLPRLLIPRPVRLLGVGEDDARARVEPRIVAPDVVVALGRALGRLPCSLEPRVLVGRVVDDQLGDHAQPARVRLPDELTELLERAVGRVDVAVLRDVVAVVAERGRVEGQQPDRVDAEVSQVVQLLGEPGHVADPVTVGVEEGLDVQLVDDRVLVPLRISLGLPVRCRYPHGGIRRGAARGLHGVPVLPRACSLRAPRHRSCGQAHRRSTGRSLGELRYLRHPIQGTQRRWRRADVVRATLRPPAYPTRRPK